MVLLAKCLIHFFLLLLSIQIYYFSQDNILDFLKYILNYMTHFCYVFPPTLFLPHQWFEILSFPIKLITLIFRKLALYKISENFIFPQVLCLISFYYCMAWKCPYNWYIFDDIIPKSLRCAFLWKRYSGFPR